MKSRWTDLSQTPSNGIDPILHGTLMEHHGRISVLETKEDARARLEAAETRPRFHIRDLASWLPGLIALGLALLGKITWLQFLGATGFGH